MTLRELITALREDILDDDGGNGVDWTDETINVALRWNNAALTRFINEAQNEVVRRIKCIRDPSMTISVTAGESLYKLDDTILDIERAKLASNGRRLMEASWEDMEQNTKKWEDLTGEPQYFISDWQSGYIKLNPTPEADDVIHLVVERLPKKALRLAQWESDKPEIHEQWQYKMLNWAAHLAYVKDEPNSLDNKKGDLHENLFTRDFGYPDNAYAVQRKKAPKRPIVYGGIPQQSADTTNRRYRNNRY